MMDNDNNLYIQLFITVQNMKTFLDNCHSCCVMHVCTNLPLGHGYSTCLLALMAGRAADLLARVLVSFVLFSLIERKMFKAIFSFKFLPLAWRTGWIGASCRLH